MLALATTLTAQPASPLEGGIPLVADGKIIGALGVSGERPLSAWARGCLE
jgi:uncharacterized protein GlcG (DUF336 family)